MDLAAETFFSPSNLNDALSLLSRPGTSVLAGGTDLIPRLQRAGPRPEYLVDISRLDELRFIELKDGTISIGALATHGDIQESELLQREAAALAEASSVVGSPQTRNRGTLGGNIANASPAGDSLPPLLVLEASVHLISTKGPRTLDLASFVRAPGKTALRPDELVHHVSFPRLPQGAVTTFERLGSRAGMAVSIASIAAAVIPPRGAQPPSVRLALGAVAPTPIRCPKAEKILLGWPFSPVDIEQAARTASLECQPIDDVRASTDYRRHAVFLLTRRALLRAAETAAGRRLP